jgi:hypothetical protein
LLLVAWLEQPQETAVLVLMVAVVAKMTAVAVVVLVNHFTSQVCLKWVLFVSATLNWQFSLIKMLI